MKCTSRADLLRVLIAEKKLNFKLNKKELAQLFRFEYQAKSATDNTKEAVGNEKYRQLPELPIHFSDLYTAPTEYQYWYVDEWKEQTVEKDAEEISDSPLTEAEKQQSKHIKPLPKHSLLSAGQWQNLWDQYLTNPNTGQGIDVPLAVKQISQGEAVHDLPRVNHKRWNKSVVLILDRSKPLRPLWPDMREAWLSLLALVGTEQLQMYFLPDGPAEQWLQPGLKVQKEGGVSTLAHEATVVILGAFGALTTGKVSDDWMILLNQLHAQSHPVVMLSVTKIKHKNVPCHLLGSSTQSSLDKLLSALALAWKPSLNQLRHLRLAIPNATLLDELMAYNHSEVEQLGANLNLKPEGLIKRLQSVNGLQEAEKLHQCTQQWQGSLSKTAQDIERLQRNLLNPLTPEDYHALQRIAYSAQSHLNRGEEMAMSYSLMRSMLPISQLLAEGESAGNWESFLRVAQQIAVKEGRALPLKHKGLQSTGDFIWLRQTGKQLVLDENQTQGLLQLGDQAYCVQTQKIIDSALSTDYKELQIIDQGQAWTLRATTQPGWSNRFWQDKQGIFSSHCENALFYLQPASAENPKAQWICRHNPWAWASDAGIDQYGLWADLQVKEVRYRLRWIKAGQFMMGSPEDEDDRSDDETQHVVTLTQGYWLGETSCTQAFWLAVMGKNPSHFNEDVQLPVERISWDDCQKFISRLVTLFPDFPAQLPTEAQWEYACRAGTKTAFWWGNEVDKKYANYHDKKTKLEINYPANDFGLKSMSGNVREWCADWLGRYSEGEATDPVGALTGQYRVLRGGSWFSGGRSLRSADRDAYGPDDRDNDIGFRLAGGIDPQASKQGNTANRGPWSGQAGGSKE